MAGQLMFEKIRILVGLDGSLQSRKALVEAITIAKHFSGFIKVVIVCDKGSEKTSEAIINEAAHELEKESISHDVILVISSDPAKILTTTAKQESIDLIVVGRRGIGSGVSLLLGSVSKKVVTNAYCNVLVVKSERKH